MPQGVCMISTAEEYRDGFLVTEKRKKIWNAQLGLAEEVKRICEKYHIKYFIIWGTLLGAVRHKGFIPWDDDFDIALQRNDYERFCKVALEEIRSPYFFQTDLTDPEFFIGYARVRDSRTTAYIVVDSSPTYNNGIFVDIYPLDVIPRRQLARDIKFWARDRTKALCLCYINKAAKKKRTLWFYLFRLLPYKYLFNLFTASCKMFNNVSNGDVGMAYHPTLVKHYHFNKRCCSTTIEMRFENTSFNVPVGYAEILQSVYGEKYMSFPPKRKRGEWHRGQIVFEPDVPYYEYDMTRGGYSIENI